MTARAPRFEVVRSDAGWHARFRAANGRKVWQTEVYERRGAAALAVRLLAEATANGFATVREVDERGAA
jgi:uncharacterized protein YegP (UPF0339 family)